MTATAVAPKETSAAPGVDMYYRLALPGLLYFLVFYVLPPPLPIRADAGLRDPSWHVILTNAFLAGTHFGRDLIYTYGPWGFVEVAQGDPRIYPWLAAARLLIALAFLAGTSLILVKKVRPLLPQAMVLAWLAVFSNPLSVLPMLLAGVVSLPDRERDARMKAVVHLLAIACALDMWIKFTSFVLIAALMGVLVVQDLLRRRVPIIPLEIGAAALAFWLVARQPLTGIVDFLRGAWSTATSYSGTMFVPGPYRELWLVVALLAAVAIPSAIALLRLPRHQWRSVGCMGAWVALMIFLQLKEAFVRYDDYHIWMGIVAALGPCALILLCLTGCFGTEAAEAASVRSVKRVCAACAVLLCVVLTSLMAKTDAAFERIGVGMQNLSGLGSIGSGLSPGDAYREQLAEFHRKAPLPDLPGSAEFFPDDQIRIVGNSLPLRLPPVPQSFAAYNDYLSGLNAAFFRGPRHPENIFLDIAPLDHRYPTAADNLSWLALLDCYRSDGFTGRYLVLHAAGCRPSSLDFLVHSTVRSGDNVAVPGAEGPVWAVIDVRLTRVGKILAAVLRPPVVTLAVETQRGKTFFSLPMEAGRMGFLLSPMVKDPAAFERLVVQRATELSSVVRSIAVNQTEGRSLFESDIDIRLYRVSRKGQLGPP